MMHEQIIPQLPRLPGLDKQSARSATAISIIPVHKPRRVPIPALPNVMLLHYIKRRFAALSNMRFPIRERLVAEMSDVKKAGSFYRNVLGARETFRKATRMANWFGPTSEQMTNPTFAMVRWKLNPNTLKQGSKRTR